jgi:hypothetical protein
VIDGKGVGTVSSSHPSKLPSQLGINGVKKSAEVDENTGLERKNVCMLESPDEASGRHKPRLKVGGFKGARIVVHQVPQWPQHVYHRVIQLSSGTISGEM